jgi:hypothetical protein
MYVAQGSQEEAVRRALELCGSLDGVACVGAVQYRCRHHQETGSLPPDSFLAGRTSATVNEGQQET